MNLPDEPVDRRWLWGAFFVSLVPLVLGVYFSILLDHHPFFAVAGSVPSIFMLRTLWQARQPKA